MHRRPVLLCAALMISALLASMPISKANAVRAQFEPVEVRPPARAPVLVYERIGSSLLGNVDALVVVYGDGTVWLHDAAPLTSATPPSEIPDEVRPLAATVQPPSVFDPPGRTPVITPAPCSLPVGPRRIHVPHESVEELARDLVSLGIARLRGGQGPGHVEDAPLTTVTFIRPNLSHRTAQDPPVATVSRANSFTFYVASDHVAEIDARIQLFLDWVRLLDLHH